MADEKYVMYKNGKFSTSDEGGGGGSGETYSTTEQIIGTWTNGKPIYSKTIKTENLILSGWQYINHGISNIEEVIKAFGSLKRVSDGHFCCIPCCRPVTADGIMIVISATQIEYINTWIATNDNTDVSFTLYYTKTTD